jgi:Rieske Fe-S protein
MNPDSPHIVSRRRALEVVGAGLIAAATAQSLAVAATPARVKITTLDKLTKVGSSVAFEFDGKKAVLVRIAKPAKASRRVLTLTQKDKSLIHLTAYTLVCTHNGCTVAAPDAGGSRACPCHGSRFAVDGAVIAGPAKTALQSVKLALEGSTVYATALVTV